MDQKEQEKEQQRLAFAALKESNEAVGKHHVPRWKLVEYFEGKTQDDRADYFSKKEELKRKSHEAS